MSEGEKLDEVKGRKLGLGLLAAFLVGAIYLGVKHREERRVALGASARVAESAKAPAYADHDPNRKGSEPTGAGSSGAVATGDSAADGSAVGDSAEQRGKPELEDPLTTYLKQSIYPPTSRRLLPTQVDLIEWNRRHERERATRNDPTTSYRFSADKYWVTGDEGITSFLEVENEGRPVPARITDAYVEPVDAAGKRVSLTYAKEGHRHTNTLAPAKLDGMEGPTKLRLVVVFEAGSGPESAQLSFVFNPPATIPARFTGEFRDEVVDGSIVVYAGVEVETAGHYLVDCNLYDSDESPVAWSRFKGRITADTTEVPLRFFGKAILDAEPRAPFSLGQLRGSLYVEGQQPDTHMMLPFDGEYTLETSSLTGISDAEWDSETKRRKVKKLRELAGSGPSIGTPIAR